ncbi:MAG: CHAT domain-containing protein [Chitinophagales bacterium]
MSYSSNEQFALAQQYYQEAEALIEKSRYKTAFPLLEKANKILPLLGEEAAILQSKVLCAISDCYSDKCDYLRGLLFNQKALDIRMEIFGELGELTLEVTISRGWIWKQQGKFHKALSYFKEILEKCAIAPPSDSLQYGVLHYQIGDCYKQIEDYWQAILYIQKSIEIFQELKKPNEYHITLCYHQIGGCYAQVGEMKEAIFYLQKAMNKYVADKKYLEICNIHITMGGIYNRLGENQQALDSYQKCVGILNTLEITRPSFLGVSYMGLGRAYGGLKNFEKGHKYLQKSLDVHLQMYGVKSPRVAHTYYNIGHLYSNEQSYLLALKNLQKGLQACIPAFEEEDIYLNPSLIDLQSIENNVAILLLATKAETFRGYYLNVATDSKNIDMALESAGLAIRLMEQIRQRYYSDHSKLAMEETHSRAYQIGLTIAHTAWKNTKNRKALEKAFLFAEKAKAVLLLSAMQGELTKIESPIPQSLLEKEQSLKKQLIQLDKAIQVQKTVKGEKDSKEAAIQNLQIEFLEYHRKYSQLMKQMEEIHPDYYQLKYQIQAISIVETQALLQSQELLIQYCLHSNQLFIFAIGVDSICFELIELDTDLALLIESFQKTVFLSDLEQYISIAHQLYALILKPIEAEWKTKKQLTIIPDGDLHRLNFDALIHPISPTESKSIEKFSQLSYLLRDFQVRYHYSATLIGQNHQKTQMDIRREIEDGFLGVAPVKFGKRETGASGYILKSKGNGREIVLKSGASEADALVDLAETEIEVKKVYELFEEQQKKATALFYEMASKEQLLEYIEDYKHILLSSHGFSDTENAALSGLNLYVENEGESTDSVNEKGKLYLSEVMNLQLKADLVVLSSCESGVGKLQQGEGMMALHRAFLYAGAKNIVYSLFKVPQDSTSELVQTFFRHVLGGDSYSAALRKAKLDLIEDESMEPIDWAGFALIGG